MTLRPEITKTSNVADLQAYRSNLPSYRNLTSIFRVSVLTASVIVIFMIFASDIDGMIKGSINFSYTLGCSMANYSAGFLRRGLSGEIVGFMNILFQPFIFLMLLSFCCLVFILSLMLGRMMRLHVKLPYILAILFSPSLILMQRGENFIRSDFVVMSLNFAASCILLHLLFHKKQVLLAKTSFAGMLAVDAVIFVILAVSALIHELSASLLPPVMVIFFIFARKARRIMHAVSVFAMLVLIYAVVMAFFTFSNSDTVAESWNGIYQNPDSFRFNSGLMNTADRQNALNYFDITLTLLRECGLVLIPHLLIAVAVPFTVLIFSGITIFHSASSRAWKARCLLIISCACPLGLSIAGEDFGRWFSLCAMNLTVYSLLTAHPAGRMKYGENTSHIKAKSAAT